MDQIVSVIIAWFSIMLAFAGIMILVANVARDEARKRCIRNHPSNGENR